MSLFDVIKYPISNPPTLEEFRAVPRELLIKWMLSNGFMFDHINYTGLLTFEEIVEEKEDDAPYRAFKSYNTYRIDGDVKELEELAKLRQLIREYDEYI